VLLLDEVSPSPGANVDDRPGNASRGIAGLGASARRRVDGEERDE
jgi:hypothetical protein